ncbi:carbohydrate porin [Sulfuriferula thiophila]|uniref:carbohydrate porin n=1 Tax=Sulfuriferula thiophila TaxID=1781211 RepID=UPI000F60A069|nr:carbohydrate porin [Sulfuriferula thiophila]
MKRTLIASSILMMLATSAHAADDLQNIRSEIQQMKASYEARIQALEARLAQTEAATKQANTKAEQADSKAEHASQTAAVAALPAPSNENAFNPAISLILSGTASHSSLSPSTYKIGGFIPSGGEVAPNPRGFSLGESELAISANIDPDFRGNFMLAMAPDNTVAVENAYLQTLGLGHGLTASAGRFYSGIGYLNNVHAHAWDFTDSPLVYKAFLGNQFGDDGVQLTWLAPTESLLVELGAEIGSGRSFPATTRDKNGSVAGALYAHVGGDYDESNSWRAGLSYLGAGPQNRSYDDTDVNGVATTNSFSGKSQTWIGDFVWKWAPNGNTTVRNFKLQGEYMHRNETGDLTCTGGACSGVPGAYQSAQSGWYLQGVYQFMPHWRVGLRHDRLNSGSVDLGTGLTAADLPILAAYNPKRNTVMFDYSPSEFSRFRVQYARDESRPTEADNQFALQYIMSLGAHGAHTF